MQTLVMGACGRAKNGKTTVADAIKEHANASGMSAFVYDIGLTILKHCQRTRKIDADKTRPELNAAELGIMISEGKRMRAIKEGYWVDMIELAIQADGFDVALIPNIRYLNEVDMVRRNGGVIVRVDATNPDGSPFISRDRDPNDISETTFLRLVPDYWIRAHVGESALVSEQAITLFRYLHALRAEPNRMAS